MKNKKGFTLIELLSVIVLIGIVLSLAVLGISSIRKTVLEKQYINVKTEIELAAEKYYNDTESTQMYVQTLLDEGYLKANNESKEIVDPRDSQNKLNCYIVDIKDEKGKLDESDEYNKNCNQELNNTYAIKIKKLKETGEIEEIEDKWYNEPFTIKAVTSAASSDETSSYYSWTTDLNPNVIGIENPYNLENLVNDRSGVIEDVFYVSRINSSGDVLKSAGQRIKIDKIGPKIEKFNVSNSTDWVKEKTISVELSDKGSGIKSYSFDVIEDCQNKESWITLDKEKNKLTVSKVVNEEGTYYFCAKDGAGNEITPEVIEVKNVDGVPPKCSYNGENTNWKQGELEISYGCEDNESGCYKIIKDNNIYDCSSNECIFYQKYNGTISTVNIINSIGKFELTDKAGNTTECPVKEKTNLNIYLDNTYPNIDITNVSYDNNYLNVTINLTDSHSGPKEACLSLNNNSDSCNWVDCSNGKCTLKLNTTISARNYYIYGKDNAGNIATKNVEVKKISSNRSGTRDYSSSFTEYLNITGKVLDYSYYSSIGSVNCNSLGKCTVYPREKSYTCEKNESPRTSDPEYVCDERDHYADRWGYCQADDCEFENDTGYCDFSNGKYIESGFAREYGCENMCGDYYEEDYVEYYCNNCSNNLGVYYRLGDLCRAMTGLSNFGNYSGSKGVTGYKICRFIEYPAEEVCDYDEELNNGTCYYCRRGYLYRNSCVYESTCYEYKYSYNYTYYVY